MEVTLKGKVFPVEIIRKNNKNMYFRFKNDTLIVTCNYFVLESSLKKSIMSIEDNLYRMYQKVNKQEFKDTIFTYLGKPCTKVFDKSIKGVYLEDDMLYAHDEKAFTKWYKEESLRVFKSRINILINRFNNIPKFSLRIRKMTSRWGVNNVTKCIITLNSELLKKDISLIDYVIVHELCHFYEANHSSRFWNEVEKRYPNFKQVRKELRS